MKDKKNLFSLRWLLFSVLIATAFSSVTMSRYITTISGTATAQTARFQVGLGETASTTMTFDGLTPGKTEIYKFDVTSDSDTAITLSARIDGFGFTSLPLTYTITEYTSGGKTTDISNVPLDSEMKNFDNMPYGNITRKYTLEITWPKDSKYNTSDFNNMIGVWKLEILAEQAS